MTLRIDTLSDGLTRCQRVLSSILVPSLIFNDCKQARAMVGKYYELSHTVTVDNQNISNASTPRARDQ